MAPKKEVVKTIKLQIIGGKANPAPPVGPALGQAGVNIMEFCKQFNAATTNQAGDTVPVVISVHKDKSFVFVTKKSPVPNLIKKKIALAKGSSKTGLDAFVGKITKQQIREIAEYKLEDLNTSDIDAACRMVEGSAKSMGLEIVAA
jgi:large subunit ribosomal protein L11